MNLKNLLKDQDGQITVEMACLVPVVVVVSLIVFNISIYLVYVGRFDRLASQAVVIHAISLPGVTNQINSDAYIKGEIEKSFADTQHITVEVASKPQSMSGSHLSLLPHLVRYDCTMKYVPFPSYMKIAGMEYKAPLYLEHTTSIVVDPYRSEIVG